MQIDFEQASFTYQSDSINACAALTDINLHIGPGELLAIIGHGGSGKSTLALLMAGLYKPTSGKVMMNGKEAKSGNKAVGLVFQYPEQQLFGETVFEEVAFGARNFDVPEDYLPIRVRQALDDVGLSPDEFWHRSPFMLSGGQKRRVCIASMLSFSPKFIILDEPAAGLDEGGRLWIIDLVKKLHKDGKTVVWITHNMSEAAELAQRIVVLNAGRIIFDDNASEVFSHEEELRAVGLDIPEAASLVRSLKDKGKPVPGFAVTVDEAYSEIMAWLRPESQGPAPKEMDVDQVEELLREWREGNEHV